MQVHTSIYISSYQAAKEEHHTSPKNSLLILKKIRSILVDILLQTLLTQTLGQHSQTLFFLKKNYFKIIYGEDRTAKYRFNFSGKIRNITQPALYSLSSIESGKLEF